MPGILEQLKTTNEIPAILAIDEREFRAVIGVAPSAFVRLLEPFSQSLAELKQQAEAKRERQRVRKVGGGRKAKLATAASRLGFILHYLKRYDTLDDLGDRVGLHRSNVSRNLQALLEVLAHTLNQLKVLPKREFATPAELQAALAGIDQIVVDATERPLLRPQNAATQKKLQRQKTSKRSQEYRDFYLAPPDSFSGTDGLGQST